uniref:Uncharacterized protein n=1 Tax=Salmonella phage SalP219 TaxID=3158864 RepID=A0AAU7PIJ9_9CAUD
MNYREKFFARKEKYVFEIENLIEYLKITHKEMELSFTGF